MPRHASRIGIAAAAFAVAIAVLLTGQGRMDTSQFWASVFLEANEAERYESLAAMRDAADAVVVGHIASVTKGRIFGDPPEDIVQYVTAVVEVERVLKGQVEEVAPNRIQLEIMVPGSASIDELVVATPASRSVYFLRHKGTELKALGAPIEIVAADQLYYRLVILRGVVWESGGQANVTDTGEPDFLTELGGQPMADVIRASTP